jgi:hypothetical protein
LKRALNDEELEARQYASSSVCRMGKDGNPDAIRLMGECLLHECELVRTTVILNLNKLAKEDIAVLEPAMPSIGSWLSKPEHIGPKEIRYGAVDLLVALTKSGNTGADEVLSSMLANPERKMRTNAVYRLAMLAKSPLSEIAIKKLECALENETDPKILEIAKKALSEKHA